MLNMVTNESHKEHPYGTKLATDPRGLGKLLSIENYINI